MRKFKHKTTGYTATETNSEKNYKISEPRNFTIPKWIVENSNDWKEVKDEYPKIISFRKIKNSRIFSLTEFDIYTDFNACRGWSLHSMLHLGECVDDKSLEIYQVAVSETEVFTLGDKLDKWEANIIRFDYNNGIIRVISDAKGEGLVTSEVSWQLKDCKKASNKWFLKEENAKKYLDENKPIYSKKQIEEALDKCITCSISTNMGSLFIVDVFKQKLNL